VGLGHRAAASLTATLAIIILVGLASANYVLPYAVPWFKPVEAKVLMAAGLATVFSATFILSLIIMDWMTATAHRRRRLEPHEPLGVLDRGEFRRALTISLTIAYFVAFSLSLMGVAELSVGSSLMDLFTKVFLVVVAFYFGSRAVERGVELAVKKRPEAEGERRRRREEQSTG